MVQRTSSLTLADLSPSQSFECHHRQHVKLSYFYGSQKLNLLRPTRMPANTRRYCPGDPVHLIDWRAFARNEQLTIREQYDEASYYQTIILQDSESLSWPDEKIQIEDTGRLCSKRELSWRIALHLAYQAFRRGDKARIYWFFNNQWYSLKLQSQLDVMVFFEEIRKSNFKKVPECRKVSLENILSERADLLYWLSDGFDGIPQWILNAKNRKFFWIHIFSSLELDHRWLNTASSYFDNGRELREYSGSLLLVGKQLLGAVHNWIEKTKKQWLIHQKQYLMLTEKTLINFYISALQNPGNGELLSNSEERL